MELHNNINVQAFARWLGVISNEYLTSSLCFTSPHEIGEVRALFEQIAQLTTKQRKQVMQWGLYNKDTATIQLIIWGTLRLQDEMIDLKLLEGDQRNNFTAALFSPFIPSCKWGVMEQRASSVI